MRVALDSRPEKIDALERRKLQLQIEEISLKKEKANEKLEVVRYIYVSNSFIFFKTNSNNQIVVCSAELKSINDQLVPLMAQYEKERGRIHEIASVKKRIEEVKAKIERFKREGQLDKVSDLQYYGITVFVSVVFCFVFVSN